MDGYVGKPFAVGLENTLCSRAARSGLLKIGRNEIPPGGYHSLNRLPLPPIILLGEVSHTQDREMIREYRRTLGSCPVQELTPGACSLLGLEIEERIPLRLVGC